MLPLPSSIPLVWWSARRSAIVADGCLVVRWFGIATRHRGACQSEPERRSLMPAFTGFEGSHATVTRTAITTVLGRLSQYRWRHTAKMSRRATYAGILAWRQWMTAPLLIYIADGDTAKDAHYAPSPLRPSARLIRRATLAENGDEMAVMIQDINIYWRYRDEEGHTLTRYY